MNCKDMCIFTTMEVEVGGGGGGGVLAKTKFSICRGIFVKPVCNFFGHIYECKQQKKKKTSLALETFIYIC